VTWQGLAGTFVLAFVFQGISLVVFSFLRRTKYGTDWLEPKRGVCPNKTPPSLTKETLFGWITELWCMEEGRILM